MLHRMDFFLESKHCRIEISQQPITHGSIGLDEPLEHVEIQLGPGDLLQHSQVVHAVRRQFARAQHFRTTKEISLEIDKTLSLRSHEFLMAFDFFRQHPAVQVAESLHQFGPLLLRRQLHLDLNNVGKRNQSLARIAAHKIVERNHVSLFFQAAASGYHIRVDWNRFQYLHHSRCRGQQRDQAFDKRVSVQLTNARRPSQRTSNPITSERSSVERAATSRSPLKQFSIPSRNSSSYPNTFWSRSTIGCRATYRSGIASRSRARATPWPGKTFLTHVLSAQERKS